MTVVSVGSFIVDGDALLAFAWGLLTLVAVVGGAMMLYLLVTGIRDVYEDWKARRPPSR
jgi:hypothetical protein